jgi:hypothetical protein
MGYFHKCQPQATKKKSLLDKIRDFWKEHGAEIAMNGMFLSGNTRGAYDMYRALKK